MVLQRRVRRLRDCTKESIELCRVEVVRSAHVDIQRLHPGELLPCPIAGRDLMIQFELQTAPARLYVKKLKAKTSAKEESYHGICADFHFYAIRSKYLQEDGAFVVP